MRGNKRLAQGIAVAGATGVLVCTVTFSQPQIMRTEETIQITENKTAGIMATLNSAAKQDDGMEQGLSIAKHDADMVSSAYPVSELNINTWADDAVTPEKRNISVPLEGSTSVSDIINNNKETENKNTEKTNADQSNTDTNASEKSKSKQKNNKKSDKEKTTADKKKQADTDSAKKWKNKLMAKVDDSLNIREASSEDSAVIGKLRKGDAAKVVKKGKEWTKIKSGSVTGYVKNEYCVYGAKAYKYANKICKTYATVQADGLRIRQKANEDSIALEAAFKGDKLLVNEKAKKKDGWVVVKLNDLKGYVSEDYVKVGLGVGEAISIEEEQAMLAAQRKAEQASLRSVSSSGSTAASSASAVSSSDLTLLSAIIFCEAGGESYAGQVAVGAVVLNRVRSSSFPNNISDVVYQSGQFSPVANGALARALSNGNYQHCISAAQAALAGSDNTGGAKFFHRVNGAAGLVIGNHVFY